MVKGVDCKSMIQRFESARRLKMKNRPAKGGFVIFGHKDSKGIVAE